MVTLPETNSSHLKMYGWKTTFLLGMPIFRCYVNFRAGSILPQHGIIPVTNASQPLVLAFGSREDEHQDGAGFEATK